MAYVTAAEVIAEIADFDTENSTINAAYFTSTIIPQAEAVAEGYLRRAGYTLPITDASDLPIVRQAVMGLCYGRYERISGRNSEEWTASAQALLQDISDGRIELKTGRRQNVVINT